MIDKSLVKRRFTKSLKTYNENAVIQKQMAQRLIELLPRNEFDSVFEIGCATGILTEQIAQKLKFKHYTGNDLVEASKKYVEEIIRENTFISGDIEELSIDKKYDLIISNAVLQWCENPKKVMEKLYSCLNDNGVLAISVFGKDNLKELKAALNLEMLKSDIQGLEETQVLYFNSPLEVLKHIKGTGANALREFNFTKSSLQAFEKRYRALFSLENKVFLTYKPLYAVKEKKVM